MGEVDDLIVKEISEMEFENNEEEQKEEGDQNQDWFLNETILEKVNELSPDLTEVTEKFIKDLKSKGDPTVFSL